MIQQYLVNGEKNIDNIFLEKIKVDKIKFEINKLTNTDLVVITYECKNNDENMAQKMSEIHENLIKTKNIVILANESSQYFCKKLYPIINEFEMNLRKLLYLSSSIKNSVAGVENIKKLEEKDLGEIFELLFTDTNYNAKVKKEINNKSWKFTREEITSVFNEFEENTLWNKLLGENRVESLVKNFLKVKNIRNDVMHAHEITYEMFKMSKKLYTKINEEIENEINYIMKNKEKSLKKDINVENFNEKLTVALNFQESLEKLQNEVKTLTLYDEIISKISVLDYNPIINQASNFSEVRNSKIDKLYDNYLKICDWSTELNTNLKINDKDIYEENLNEESVTNK
ncbi:MAG: hypothetical protein R3Y21_02450 [Mycoplasmatota bacterium]